MHNYGTNNKLYTIKMSKDVASRETILISYADEISNSCIPKWQHYVHVPNILFCELHLNNHKYIYILYKFGFDMCILFQESYNTGIQYSFKWYAATGCISSGKQDFTIQLD